VWVAGWGVLGGSSCLCGEFVDRLWTFWWEGRAVCVCVCVVSSKGMRLKGQEGGIVGLRTT
jgi:hypothetical protein